MMNSAAWIYFIIGSYLFFIKWLGPRIMRDRTAFDLKPILIIYNTIQAVANLCIGIYVGANDP